MDVEEGKNEKGKIVIWGPLNNKSPAGSYS